MGESMVEAPNIESKMGESVNSHSSLEVSISFGRFENDSLSWEKWSTFSPNKYLEEVEKCSTPGSVAQKKAYFEAHYKKIAARKAEMIEQENLNSDDDLNFKNHTGNVFGSDGQDSSFTEEAEQENLISDDLNIKNHTQNMLGSDAELCISNCQDCTEEVEVDTNSISVVSSTLVDGPKEDDANSTLVEECKEELKGNSEDNEFNEAEEAVSVKEENLLNGPQDMVEQSEKVKIKTKSTSESKVEMVEQPEKVEIKASTLESKVEIVEQPEILGTETRKNTSESKVEMVEQPEILEIKTIITSESKVEMVEQPEILDIKTRSTSERKVGNMKSGGRRISQKITPTRTERNLVGSTKKKPVSPILKSPQNSTPVLSKPTSTSTVMSASRPSAKKWDISSLPRSKNSSMGEGKRVGPTSLHMSLSLDTTAESDSAPPMMTRRSLIMEKMGDKDIVKRAFKTFQNSLNQQNYSNDEKSCGPKQLATKASEKKVPPTKTSQTVNERMKKSTEMMNTQRGQLGTRWNSTSTGSLREAAVDGRSVKPASSSTHLRTNERTEKRKEFLKKFEEKSYTKDTEKMRLSSKTKEEKEAEMKKLRQSFNFKAKPMPDFYGGQGISKTTLEKEGAKSEIGYR